MVGCRRLPAAVASPAVMAVRRRRIRVRTRVRFARLTSARSRDCAARFKTDFFFFLTLVACPWAIYRSFCVSLKLLTLNEAWGFVNELRISECKPPLWCLTKCGDWRYSYCVSCSVNTTRRRLLHVTNFTRTARSKRCRSQSGPCQDRGYAPGISERDVRKVWKADLSLCQVRIARTRSELAFDADRGRQDRGPTDPLRTSGRAIKAAGGRVQALS